MTDPIRDDRFEHELSAFLAWETRNHAGAPTASEMAARIASTPAARSLGTRPMPMLAWLLLAGLLTIAVAGAALIGAGAARGLLARDDRAVLPATTFESVFLRKEPGGDLAVVRVGASGRATKLLDLPGAELTNGAHAIWPVGAVSRGGWLVVSRPVGSQFRWEIFDLNAAQAAPIVVSGIQQDVEPFLRDQPYVGTETRGGVFGGPDDRLGILWYEHVPYPEDPSSFGIDLHLTFVDGRTGAARHVDIPEDLWVLPRWVPDGSGVLVVERESGRLRGVLRPDGTIVQAAPQSVGFCESPQRPFDTPALFDEAFECLAPDASLAYDSSGTLRPTGDGPDIAVEGGWAGWMEVAP